MPALVRLPAFFYGNYSIWKVQQRERGRKVWKGWRASAMRCEWRTSSIWKRCFAVRKIKVSRGLENAIIIITHYYSPVVSHVTRRSWRSFRSQSEKEKSWNFHKMEHVVLNLYSLEPKHAWRVRAFIVFGRLAWAALESLQSLSEALKKDRDLQSFFFCLVRSKNFLRISAMASLLIFSKLVDLCNFEFGIGAVFGRSLWLVVS